MEIVPLFIYAFFLTFILFYSVSEFHLVLSYLFRKKIPHTNKLPNDLPFVTIQLPVYNEANVIEDLIKNCAAIDYPKSKFEIQVIDDSTDETTSLIESSIQPLIKEGFQIQHLRRPNREGYKAGALAYGLPLAKGEFIAIFDADFYPSTNFLKETIPYFSQPETGVVQTRWGHHNKNYSLITRLQALALDAHFTIEQVGRNQAKSFINFNGTAGIWRKKCIEESGGWQSDTITEDLDLSYRAQLKGWKFIYREEIVSPAELPVEMNGLKNQQLRWSKGAAECARKHLGKVWKAKNVSSKTKIHATFHLMNSFLYICILAIALMSYPVMKIAQNHPEHSDLYSWFYIYYLSLLLITLTYGLSEWISSNNKTWAIPVFILLFPFFLSISMGLSLFNAIGVAEGYLGIKSPFVRTPKFNIKNRKSQWSNKKYAFSGLKPITLLEGLLFIYFCFCLYQIIADKNTWAYPYFIMLSTGFGFVFFSSIIHALKSKH